MANYFSLPLELRQQILGSAVETATSYDEAAVEEIGDPWGPLRLHLQIWRRKYADDIDDYAKLILRASIDDHMRCSYEVHSSIKEAISSRTTTTTIASYPIVYGLILNLLAVHNNVAGDLVWVLDTWAAGVDAKALLKRRYRLTRLNDLIRKLPSM